MGQIQNSITGLVSSALVGSIAKEGKLEGIRNKSIAEGETLAKNIVDLQNEQDYRYKLYQTMNTINDKDRDLIKQIRSQPESARGEFLDKLGDEFKEKYLAFDEMRGLIDKQLDVKELRGDKKFDYRNIGINDSKDTWKQTIGMANKALNEALRSKRSALDSAKKHYEQAKGEGEVFEQSIRDVMGGRK